MGAHTIQLRARGSSGSHSLSRPGFKLYWEVRNGVGSYVANFPGDLAYPGLTPGKTVGLSSRTVQTSVTAAMESAIYAKPTFTGGNGGVSGTSVTITSNGQRVQPGVRVTGTGIPANTFIVSYSPGGSASGTMIISQAAAISNGTSITQWLPAGSPFNVVGGNGGVSSTTVNITAGGTDIVVGVNCGICGYGIPWGTRIVSYTGGATGTLVLDTPAAIPDGCVLEPLLGSLDAQLFFADYEGGGETGSDMQNIMTWMRMATGWGGTWPTGFPAPPLGIYGNNQCAMNRLPREGSVWTASDITTNRAANDAMTSAITGAGNAACNWIGPEVYFNGRADECATHLRFLSSEFTRQGLGNYTKMIPLINPRYAPGRSNAGLLVTGPGWRAVLEAGIHDPNVYGMYIWHGDRPIAWDASEPWFVETLDFINTYGITNGTPF